MHAFPCIRILQSALHVAIEIPFSLKSSHEGFLPELLAMWSIFRVYN